MSVENADHRIALPETRCAVREEYTAHLGFGHLGQRRELVLDILPSNEEWTVTLVVNRSDRVAHSGGRFGDDVHRSGEVGRNNDVVINGKHKVEVERGGSLAPDELGDVLVADGRPDVVDACKHGLRANLLLHIGRRLGRVAVVDDDDLPGLEVDESGERGRL